ncbi:MAG: hypothetical protein KAX13_05595 [Candidatus Krumholzibacteria bacterium]|nr:hypothetical protein [Candidatus Krumholzibacteria bacterium]
MLRHPGKTALLVAVTIILSYSFGCILSPEEEVRPDPRPPANFAPLTAPDSLIYNLVLAYGELHIEEYSKLLLRTDDGDYGQEYYWYNQIEDVENLGEESYPREADITRTGNLFQAAKTVPVKPEHPIIDSYVFKINPGTWAPEDSLWGEPCEDCWVTERGYYIKISVGEDSITGDDRVRFYVVPIQVGDVTEYRIAVAKDVFY